MSTEVRWRDGTTAETAVFTGAISEITVDTDKKVVVVHDGVTPGGHPGTSEAAVTLKLVDYAKLLSPAFTGTPTAPTPSVGDNTTKVATTAYVKSQNYAPLASPPLTGVPTAPTAVFGTATTQLATTQFVADAVANSTSVAVRQTIQYGPKTGTFSALIPQSQIGNTLAAGVTLKHSTASTFYSVANGFDALSGGPVNNNWVVNADVVVPGLAASVTNYIWVDTVTHTAGATSVKDLYQFGGTISVVNGQYTFDYDAFKMYLGNGTVANQSNRIIVAEVDTSGVAVVAIRCRPYRGSFISLPQTPPSGGTANSVQHNSGFAPLIRAVFTNITPELGYSAGDEVQYSNADNGGQAVSIFSDIRSVGVVTAGSFVFMNKTGSPARSTILNANWQIRYFTTPPWK